MRRLILTMLGIAIAIAYCTIWSSIAGVLGDRAPFRLEAPARSTVISWPPV